MGSIENFQCYIDFFFILCCVPDFLIAITVTYFLYRHLHCPRSGGQRIWLCEVIGSGTDNDGNPFPSGKESTALPMSDSHSRI